VRIAYGFMKYPVPAQPFAISDIQALERAGHRVEPYALSGKHRNHAATCAAYGLEFGERAHPSWRTGTACASPRNLDIETYLFRVLAAATPKRPKEMWKAWALAPRLVEVAGHLRREPPDVVHAFWGHFPALLLILGKRFYPQTHRSLFLGAYDLTSHLSTFAPLAASCADSVWTHSEANLPLLEKLGVPMEKVTVVHRGIPLDLASDDTPEKIPGRICSAANFQREKRLDRVLTVFAEVSRRMPRAQLVMVGDGEADGELKALAERLGLADRVHFTGHLSREALFREMRRSEVFLFLSTKVSERLPNVVKEAMLAECYCLVSPSPGIGALIEPGVTGEIVDRLDVVAGRIEEIMLSPRLRNVGKQAARYVRRTFSADNAMRRYAEVWEASTRKSTIAT
jgi:glycosyltransferase involved in cell wall biosynthesis